MAAFDYPGEWAKDAEGHLVLRLPPGMDHQLSLSLLAAKAAKAAKASKESKESKDGEVGVDALADAGLKVAAKAETFKFAFKECHDLKIEGLSYYATALMIYDSERAIVRGSRCERWWDPYWDHSCVQLCKLTRHRK